MKHRKTQFKTDAYYHDLLAIFIGLVLFLFLFVTVKLGVGIPEEATFLTIPQRLYKGDRLLIDDWNLPQLSTLFSLIPFRIYVLLTGTTEGIILWMRYLFLSVDAVYYVYMYRRLRQYKLWGLLSTILFCGIIPVANFCLNYYTVAPMALMAVCLTLFIGDFENSRFRLFLTGVVFALSVLAEPFLLGLFILYGIIFVLRKLFFKNRSETIYSYLFSNRVFLWMTLGAFFLFLLFMGYLFFAGILQDLPSVLPYLVTGIEYNSSNFTDFSILLVAFSLFGKSNLILIALTIPTAFICYYRYNNPLKFRTLLFIFSIILLLSCYISCGTKMATGRLSYVYGAAFHDFPMLFIPLIWFLLCKEKNERFFIIWFIGFTASVLIDYSSDIILASCGRITQTAGFVFLGNLLKELRTEYQCEKKTVFRSKKAVLKIAKDVFQTVCIAAIILWGLSYIILEGINKPAEKYYNTEKNAFSVTLKKGPYMGLITTTDIAQKYNAVLNDLDVILQNANPSDVLYVRMQCPYTYLYADMPFGTFSAGDQDPLERHAIYWALLPNKRPTFIYLCKYNGHSYQQVASNIYQQEINYLTSIANCDITEGEAGIILKVQSWKGFF